MSKFKIVKHNSYPEWHIQLYSKKGYFLSGLSGLAEFGYKSYEDAKKVKKVLEKAELKRLKASIKSYENQLKRGE